MKKITPLTLMLFCQSGMIVLHWLLPLRSTPSWLLFTPGIGLMVLGFLIALAAEGQFRRSGTTVDHLGSATRLVTDGWFKLSRNPMYLSMVLTLMGAWLALGSLSPFLMIVLYLLLTERWYVVPEEKRLSATFGQEYESYRLRTRRWL
jgi:protein-S-isoprenylcysteine O-methyltransferase Ste14